MVNWRKVARVTFDWLSDTATRMVVGIFTLLAILVGVAIAANTTIRVLDGNGNPQNYEVTIGPLGGYLSHSVIGDGATGANLATVKPASTATAATDLPLVVALSPVGSVGYDFFLGPSSPLTIQNAAYSSGNCMGGFQTYTVGTTAGLSGLIDKVSLISNGGLITAKQIYIFSSNPSTSTCTDRSTFTISVADRAKLVATFSLTPALPTGVSWSEAEASNLADHFTTVANGNVYLAIVETTSETPASTTDLVMNVSGQKDQP